ncbi:hypothetical protein F5B20DRAFT_588879 [Whalleya microplaca]|nr:hypothetical protein F5B20DRAFT_588879 [Whalleya microplaca]
MKLVNILSIAALANIANAIDCYKRGEKWDDDKNKDKNAALSMIDTLCTNGTFNVEYPAGTWDDNHPVEFAWDISSTRTATFAIWLNNIWGSVALDSYSCKDGLKKQVNHCSHGGVTQYTYWKYRGDINVKKKI